MGRKEAPNPALSPDGTVVTIQGREFARVLPKRCPWCQATFYAYQVLDEVHEPHRIDPEPEPGAPVQQRGTCMAGECLTAEWRHQARRAAARAPKQVAR